MVSLLAKPKLLCRHKPLQNPGLQGVKAAPNHLSRWLTAEWLLTVAGATVVSSGEWGGGASKRKGKAANNRQTSQPARILGYKQPQMLNFRHSQ